METRILTIAFILAFGFTARSQVSSTDLSYFPHSIGDTWTYKVSVDKGTGSGPVFSHYSTTTIDKDSLFASGKRYYHYDNWYVRIDSLDGRVYIFDGYSSGACPDPYEWELMNVTVDTCQAYSVCHTPLQRWEVSSRDSRAGLLDITRHQRIWDDGMWHYIIYAQGIGISYSEGAAMGGRMISELIHAVIGGREYWPVEYRSIEAFSIGEKKFLLRWVTINEVNNAGFHVDRRIDGEAEWRRLGFVPSRPQGDGEYRYLDALDIPLIPGAKIQYRLVQQDFDGTLSYAPAVSVVHDPVVASSPMLRVYPNPARDQANIVWDVRHHSNTTIFISDRLGRIVWNAVMPANSDRIVWNCRRDDGTAVPPGVYLVCVNDGISPTFGRIIVAP
jgi:hypothetical protein